VFTGKGRGRGDERIQRVASWEAPGPFVLAV